MAQRHGGNVVSLATACSSGLHAGERVCALSNTEVR
jgi:hypothetical protein